MTMEQVGSILALLAIFEAITGVFRGLISLKTGY